MQVDDLRSVRPFSRASYCQDGGKIIRFENIRHIDEVEHARFWPYSKVSHFGGPFDLDSRNAKVKEVLDGLSKRFTTSAEILEDCNTYVC